MIAEHYIEDLLIECSDEVILKTDDLSP